MHVRFFSALRSFGVPVSLREWLGFAEALSRGASRLHVVDYYHLARTTLVKDERHFDRFDRAFAFFYEGLEEIEDPLAAIPQEWLEANHELLLSEEQLAQLEEMGGWEELLETLKKRLEEQKERHEGGSKWIGTGGTSPFGAWGANAAGHRIGQHRSRLRRAVKVWDKREFADLYGDVEMGTRAMKLALRKLRRLGRSGSGEELDLDGVGWLVGGLFSLAYLPIWAYVALGFLLVPYVVSIESHRPVASLRRSWELSEPHRVTLLGMWFVGFLVELAWVAVSLVFLLVTCCVGLPLVLLLSLFPAAWIEAAWYEAMLRHVLPPPEEGLWADREEEARTRPTGPAGAGPGVEVAEDGR